MPTCSALVVEDDQELGEIFVEILQLAGLETALIRDGKLALDAIAEKRPAIIILDIHLPHVSGIDILNYIRADDRLKNIKVLLVTADATILKTIQHMADETMLKPISGDELIETTMRLLGLPNPLA